MSLFLLALLGLSARASDVDIDACRAEPLSLPADLEEAKKGVLVVVLDGDVVGSAVVVDPEGIALTAAHVVGTASEVTVRTAAGMELSAEVVTADTESDVAVIDVMGKGHPCLAPAADRPKTGTDLFAIGSPTGAALAFSVAKGVVAGYPEIEGRRFLQTDASLNPGNSGGPILTPEGRVAAVVSWKVAGTGYEGLGFGIPIDVVRDVVGGGVLGGVIGGVITEGSAKATLNFTSTKDGVTIAVLAGQQSTTGATQYGTVSFVQTQWDDVCIAPCSKEFKPGVYTFLAYGDQVEGIRHKIEVKAGEQRSLITSPRAKGAGGAGRAAVAVGLTTLITGATIWGTMALVDEGDSTSDAASIGKQITLAGALITGGGWAVLSATRGKWEE